MQIRRVFAFCAVVALGTASSPALAQRNNDNRQQRVDPDAQALSTFVDLTMLNDPAVTGAGANTVTLNPGGAALPSAPASEIDIRWRAAHFMKGQGGQTYIPFTLDVDRTALPARTAAMYVRVVTAEQAREFSQAVALMQKTTNENERRKIAMPTYAWNSLSVVELPAGGPVQRAMLLSPGKYVVFVAMKERSDAQAGANANQRNNRRNDRDAAPPAPPKIGLLRHEIDVPGFEVADLKASSVILATAIEPLQSPLSPQQQEANPYVFGPMRVVPSLDGQFSKSGNLNVIFWIYGAGDAGSGKPDVTLDFNFHQRLPEGEKYFNRTQPQPLNASTLPPDFSTAAGHQLPGSLEVPLASFPAGDYRLEITVTDKVSGRKITENVNFTVLPV